MEPKKKGGPTSKNIQHISERRVRSPHPANTAWGTKKQKENREEIGELEKEGSFYYKESRLGIRAYCGNSTKRGRSERT